MKIKQTQKWDGVPVLKAHWYDDHFGFDGLARDVVENQLKAVAAPLWKTQERPLLDLSVQGFFDLLASDEA